MQLSIWISGYLDIWISRHSASQYTGAKCAIKYPDTWIPGYQVKMQDGFASLSTGAKCATKLDIWREKRASRFTGSKCATDLDIQVSGYPDIKVSLFTGVKVVTRSILSTSETNVKLVLNSRRSM